MDFSTFETFWIWSENFWWLIIAFNRLKLSRGQSHVCYQIKWKHRILLSQKKKKKIERKKERKNTKRNQNSNVSLLKYSNLGTLVMGNLVITRYIIIMILFYIVGRFYLKKRMTRDDSEFLTNIFSLFRFFYL